MRDAPDTTDAATLALDALAWTLGEPACAERLLATTGLSPGALRRSADDMATLAAVLGFLEAHEPDLVACAAVLGVQPGAIVAARRTLNA